MVMSSGVKLVFLEDGEVTTRRVIYKQFIISFASKQILLWKVFTLQLSLACLAKGSNFLRGQADGAHLPNTQTCPLANL